MRPLQAAQRSPGKQRSPGQQCSRKGRPGCGRKRRETEEGRQGRLDERADEEGLGKLRLTGLCKATARAASTAAYQLNSSLTA